MNFIIRNSEKKTLEYWLYTDTDSSGPRARVCLEIRSTTSAESGQAEVNAKENKVKDLKPPLQSVHAYLTLQLAKFHQEKK